MKLLIGGYPPWLYIMIAEAFQRGIVPWPEINKGFPGWWDKKEDSDLVTRNGRVVMNLSIVMRMFRNWGISIVCTWLVMLLCMYYHGWAPMAALLVWNILNTVGFMAFNPKVKVSR